MLKYIFFSLFTQFSIGLIFTILFVSIKEIGNLFYRVTTGVAFILMVLAMISHPFANVNVTDLMNIESNSTQVLTYWFFILSMFFILIYNLMHPRFHKQLLSVVVTFGIIAVGFYSVAIHQSLKIKVFENVLFVMNDIAATLILGSALGAMITGHWYLVQHKLSLTPLKHSVSIYLSSVIFRIIMTIFTIIFYWKLSIHTTLIANLASLNFTSYIFIGRIVIGLFIPLLFGVMVWKTAKIRAKQSATGILYATIIMVLIGETFAKFLNYTIGIPL
ncbi:MAG: hypothetical protein ACE5HX_04370 [bacterium]